MTNSEERTKVKAELTKSLSRMKGNEEMTSFDMITEEGKKAIVILLNKSLQVEYGLILNYPRIVEQLENIEKTEDKELINNMERFGKDSLRHSAIVSRLIEELGDKPDYELLVIERTVDIHSMMVEQLAKEKTAMSIYKDAKRITEKNQVKSKGFFGDLLKRKEKERHISRQLVIEDLARLQIEELGHMKRVELLLTRLGSKKDE